MVSPEPIRPLSEHDVAAALELSSAAGWNQTAGDWNVLLRLNPESCFGIEIDDRLVATTTLMIYGRRLAWIGMVLTRGEYRGRGLARSLMMHALRHADAKGIGTVKLDATEQGEPLYKKLGFVAEQAVERWSREAGADNARGDIGVMAEYSRNLDERACGVNRSELLSALAPNGGRLANQAAHAFFRPGRLTNYLGPCVASDPQSAARAIESCLPMEAAKGWSWDLLPQNVEAAGLASCMGFQAQRRLLRMRRGRELRGEENLVYGIAGFEFG